MAGKTRANFGIKSDEPCGTTFEHAGPGSRAGATNTKRKADFGVEVPTGPTITTNRSHINMPNADRKPKESKQTYEAGGQGSTYSPPRSSGNKDFGGSVGVGKSSPKRGRTMDSHGKL